MTEKEWNSSNDPRPMLEFWHTYRGDRIKVATPRKLRLFACACCRAIWHLLRDERCRQAVETAERFADEVSSREELAAAQRDAQGAADAEGQGAAAWVSELVPVGRLLVGKHRAIRYANYSAVAASAQVERFWIACQGAASEAAFSENGYIGEFWGGNRTQAYQMQGSILRDIFGPLPFRQVPVDPNWISAQVKQLAEAIYEGRAFDRLPILGDALEEAGCGQAEILKHCRGAGPHVRGCWVVDLVLGKE